MRDWDAHFTGENQVQGQLSDMWEVTLTSIAMTTRLSLTALGPVLLGFLHHRSSQECVVPNLSHVDCGLEGAGTLHSIL